MKTKLARAARWLALALAVAGYCLLLWRGPWLLDGAHIRDTQLEPADGVVITGVRTMLVALGAGAIAGLGLYYTSRNHRLAQQQFEHTQEQFTLAQRQFDLAQQQFRHAEDQTSYGREKDRKAEELAREAQVTERYVAAIKLLASDKATERLGGIYSLHRIAEDSPRDHDTIVQVLSSFARERARARRAEVDPAEEGGLATALRRLEEVANPFGRVIPSDDINAAIFVVNRLEEDKPDSEE